MIKFAASVLVSIFFNMAFGTSQICPIEETKSYKFVNVVTGKEDLDNTVQGDLWGLRCDYYPKWNLKNGETNTGVSSWYDGWLTKTVNSYVVAENMIELKEYTLWYNDEHPEKYNPKKGNSFIKHLRIFKMGEDLFLSVAISNFDIESISTELYKMTPK